MKTNDLEHLTLCEQYFCIISNPFDSLRRDMFIDIMDWREEYGGIDIQQHPIHDFGIENIQDLMKLVDVYEEGKNYCGGGKFVRENTYDIIRHQHYF